MGTRRWLIVGIAVFVLVPFIAEAKGTRVHWTFSGAFVQNLAKADSAEIDLGTVTGRLYRN